jgi:hypothetical protein
MMMMMMMTIMTMLMKVLRLQISYQPQCEDEESTGFIKYDHFEPMMTRLLAEKRCGCVRLCSDEILDFASSVVAHDDHIDFVCLNLSSDHLFFTRTTGLSPSQKIASKRLFGFVNGYQFVRMSVCVSVSLCLCMKVPVCLCLYVRCVGVMFMHGSVSDVSMCAYVDQIKTPLSRTNEHCL